MISRPSLRLAGIPIVLALVAACTSSTATPIVRFSPGDSAAATDSSAVAGSSADALATDSAAPSTMETMSPAMTATAPPAGTVAPRVLQAWVHGQIVRQYALVGPGVGWVWTTTGLWLTTNDGAGWVDAYPHRLHLDAVRGMTALDANHALLAAVDEGPATSTYYIWHTSDAGMTWAYSALPAIPHDIHTGCAPGDFCGRPGDPAAVMDYVNANTAFVTIGMGQGTDGMHSWIFGTTDGGLHWSSRAWTASLLPSGPDPIERVQFQTPTSGVVEGANEIAGTATGWGHWNDRLFSSEIFNNPAVNFLSSTNWMAGGGLDFGTVHYRYAVSADHGATWVEHTTSVPGFANLSDAQVTFLSPTEWIGTVMTAPGSGAGQSFTIYTTDGGVHWAQYGPQPFNGSNATFIDANHGWAGPIDPLLSGGILTTKVWTTSDRGLRWTLITP